MESEIVAQSSHRDVQADVIISRVRRFGRQFVNLKRTQEAHDRMGHASRDLGERIEFGDRSIC